MLLLGCATHSTKEQQQIKDHLEQKNFTAALEVLEKSNIKKDASSEVLYLMEKGSILFHQQNYLEAASLWQQALEKIAASYIKISQVATSSVLSDKLKDYLPKDYEISYLYYFQALAFYFEYLKTQDRKHLLQARASVVAWDSYLQNLKIEKEFKSLYFDDYYARFFAGLIHETLNEKNDLEIAFQLYKDAYQLFLLQAPTYVSFGQDPSSYGTELLKKLQSKEQWREQLLELSRKNQKLEIESFQKTRKFLASKILHLAKNIRKSEVKKLKKSLEMDDAKTDIEDNVNAVTLWHDGWVNPLEAKSIRLSLTAAAKDGSASQAVLAAVTQVGFLVFANKVLGLSGGSSHHGHSSVSVNWYGTGDITEAVADVASLEFEVPSVEMPKPQHSSEVHVLFDDEMEKTPDQDKSYTLTSMQSFDDIIFQAVEREKAKALFIKGARFMSKQIAAMIASYAIYKGILAKDSNSEGIAKLSAMASYFGSSKLIQLSERTDVRHWSLLPASVGFSTLHVPKETKMLHIKKPDGSSFDFPVSKTPSKGLKIIPLF